MATPAPKPTPPKRVNRLANLRWVKVGNLRVSGIVQRDLNSDRVDYIIANYDEDKIGALVVSHRDGEYWIIDGQHRAAATLLKFGKDIEIQCWLYEGLTEKDEAEMFLRYNDVLQVNAFDKFHISVEAERPVESDINRIVRSHGLNVGRNDSPGMIHAPGALRNVYTNEGAGVLARSLEALSSSFGDGGLGAMLISGMGLFLGRYPEIDMERLVTKLSAVRGGANGVLGRSETLRRQTNLPKKQCVAAVLVEIYNSGRGGKKLSPWFK